MKLLKPLKGINVICLVLLSLLLIAIVHPIKAFGWGRLNHIIISELAYDLLEDWEKNKFGAYGDSLIYTYCLYPDLYRRKEFKERLKPYIKIPYIQSDGVFHKTENTSEGKTGFDNLPDFYIFTYFIEKSIKYLRQDNIIEASKHIGVLAHYIEDNSCPVHVVDNPLLEQLLPAPERLKDFKVHGNSEGPEIQNLNISNNNINKLGENVFETVNNIIPKFNQMQLNSRAQAIPIIMGIYDDDFNKANKGRAKAAEPAVKLLADTIHTIFSLAFNR
ncbi:zinc dependent phospholipase C family protein [candidate division KSB1 bacterium]